MRRLYFFLSALGLLASFSVGQVYKYVDQGPFPDSSFSWGGTLNVGIGVDPAGKVWIQTRHESGGTPTDSIQEASGVYTRMRPIYVFNPNGTQASFSPIRTLTGPDQNNVTVTDTLFKRAATGANIDPTDGNFVAVWGTLSYKPGGILWEIDYKTGAGVRRVLPVPNVGTNIASVAVNADGEFFTCSVLSGAPGQIVNPDGSAGVQFAANVPDIGRAIAVSADGNDVYVPRFTVRKTYVYHSNSGSFGPYVLQDSILLGASVEGIAIHPVTGYVWMSVDRRSTSDTISTIKRTWTPNTFYAYNPVSKSVVDSFNVAAWDPGSTGPLPRGMAFSPTGDTVYVAHFDVPTEPVIRRFTRVLTSVERLDEPIVPSGYVLEQNFPNPFNPTTEIHFKIANSGATTLRVYDVLGREVAALVDEFLAPGAYKARFDASRLTSGTYVYVLTSGETRISKKMMLMK